jgi:hypothetical protein
MKWRLLYIICIDCYDSTYKHVPMDYNVLENFKSNSILKFLKS